MTILLLASIALAVAIAWMRGGKLSRLGEMQFELWWVVPAVAVVQALGARLGRSPGRFSLSYSRSVTMIASFAALWIVVWCNRRLPGIWWVLAGVTLNLSVIAANGGYMPIPPEAAAHTAGREVALQVPVGSALAGSKDILLPPQQARFWFLGDVVVIPAPFPWPTAMSIGDIVLAVGIFWFIVRTSQPEEHTDDKPRVRPEMLSPNRKEGPSHPSATGSGQ
ncbi:MAG: DUF5317 domain-containing protein [Anaerolineae bacterium]|nr:DUF5317 domain-containing protein [Anaerolineae bacterium]